MEFTRLAVVLLAVAWAVPAWANLFDRVPFCRANTEERGITEELYRQNALFTQLKDNYFISGWPEEGTDPRNFVRFQLSVKFNLLPTASRCTLYFGYTQRSFWNLWHIRGSSPFEDSNYNPSVFLAWTNQDFTGLHPTPPSGFNLFFVHAGYEHESNGRDEDASRGWERLSATSRFGWHAGDSGWHLVVQPKAWIPFVGGPQNPDLLDYYGYGTLTVEVGLDSLSSERGPRLSSRDFVLGMMGRVGRNFDRGYAEIWARYRPPFDWLGLSVFAQLSTGYGETMLRYDQRLTAVRVGLALDDRMSWSSSTMLPE